MEGGKVLQSLSLGFPSSFGTFRPLAPSARPSFEFRHHPRAAPPGLVFTHTETPLPKLTILVPALNEEDGIVDVLARIPIDRLHAQGLQTQILVVDGHSTDQTRARAEALGAHIFIQSSRGKGSAIREALSTLDSDFAVMIDADGSYPPEEIPRLVSLLQDGYEVVSGSRLAGEMEDGAMSMSHRMGNAVFTTLATILYGQNRTSDLCTGLWAFRVHSVRRMNLTAQGFELEADLFTESVLRGLRHTEVPISFGRRRGKAKISWRSALKIVRTLVSKRLPC